MSQTSEDGLSLCFIGLGLHDERGITIRGLEKAKEAGVVYAEFYTNPMPRLSLGRLEEMVGKPIRAVDRAFLEGDGAEEILKRAVSEKVALLVPGDPMIATTHCALRIEALKRGIGTQVIHGTSIVSAAISLSGLHNYKFGRSVTVPFARSETPYDVIRDNKTMGLHTLVFLDAQVEKGKYMTIREGLDRLLATEEVRKEGLMTLETLVIGLARVGSDDSMVKAEAVRRLVKCDFGRPPHLIIAPSKLHFTEAQALIALCGAPKEAVGSHV